MLPNVLHRSAADHVPVLADEVRELLAVRPGETVVDATFGAGGHARLLAADLHGQGKLRRDRPRPRRAQRTSTASRHSAGVQTRFLRGEFSVVLSQLAANDVKADAILLDLGVSSMQVDRPERGFSYATDAPLDMRMDPTAELSARDLVNEARRARAGADLPPVTARSATRARSPARSSAAGPSSPFERTGELVDTIKPAIPTPARFGDGHPAKRVFQALRIAVNDELGALEAALPAAPADAAPGRPARRHQLPLARGPDRQALPPRAGAGAAPARPSCPICVCGKEPTLRDLTRRPVRPSAARGAGRTRAPRRRSCVRR